MKKTLIIIGFLILSIYNIVRADGVYYTYPNSSGTYKVFDIKIPENIEYSEYLYNSGRANQVDPYSLKLIRINSLLIKKGLDPLYF